MGRNPVSPILWGAHLLWFQRSSEILKKKRSAVTFLATQTLYLRNAAKRLSPFSKNGHTSQFQVVIGKQISNSTDSKSQCVETKIRRGKLPISSPPPVYISLPIFKIAMFLKCWSTANIPVKPRPAGAWTCRKRHAIYFARYTI